MEQSLFQHFTNVYHKYFDFNGRSRRSEYWGFNLYYMIIMLILTTLEYMFIDTFMIYMLLIGVSAIFGLVSFIPALAVTVRRLHDTGKSGWRILWILLPLIGSIMLIVWLCQDSTPGANEYGENPKGL